MDCQRCGACCAHYRVSFYWAEGNDAPGGQVPVELTEPLTPHLRCMRGTSSDAPHCVALQGEVGVSVGCSIYAQRPTTCHEVQVGDAQCLKARAHHGIT